LTAPALELLELTEAALAALKRVHLRCPPSAGLSADAQERTQSKLDCLGSRVGRDRALRLLDESDGGAHLGVQLAPDA
jgi:hypothetical protein